jgi:hypothetical protein
MSDLDEHRVAGQAALIAQLVSHPGWHALTAEIEKRVATLIDYLCSTDLDLDRQRLYAGELYAYRRLFRQIDEALTANPVD